MLDFEDLFMDMARTQASVVAFVRRTNSCFNISHKYSKLPGFVRDRI